MLSSVDGRTDGDALEGVTTKGEYEAISAQLGGEAWVCGRTTMLMLVPGVDGRHGIASLFDGMNLFNNAAIPLKLKSVEQRAGDTLWIRYLVRS